MAIADDPPITRTTAFWHPFADMGAVSRAEFVIERGEGVYVFDTAGRRYLDGTASLWYSNLGYGRREVHEAVAAQMARIEAYSTFGDFGNPPANALARRLPGHGPVERGPGFFWAAGGGTSDA